MWIYWDWLCAKPVHSHVVIRPHKCVREDYVQVLTDTEATVDVAAEDLEVAVGVTQANVGNQLVWMSPNPLVAQYYYSNRWKSYEREGKAHDVEVEVQLTFVVAADSAVTRIAIDCVVSVILRLNCEDVHGLLDVQHVLPRHSECHLY